MTFLALIAIIFFGFAVYNLTCAFVDIPTKKTSQMMMLSRKQQGTKNEKLLDVYQSPVGSPLICGWDGSSASGTTRLGHAVFATPRRDSYKPDFG